TGEAAGRAEDWAVVAVDSAAAAAASVAAARQDGGEMNMQRLLRHLATTDRAVRRAFPPCALDAIEQAIRTGEFQHGGQLRFVVEGALDGSPLWRNQSPGERALDLFARLGVWDTAHNSGVLIYVLLADRAVEIVADRGIHACCGAERWSAVCQRMEAQFAQGRFEAGALEGIVAVSHLLVQHFPRGADHGNELPDRPVLL
ncbi:TPA: TPM domain-containing protein, partial [Pseudomonas aeruginosa]